MELLDGATGVWLPRETRPEGTASAALHEPERLRSLAEAYATAGARLLRSATFAIPAALSGGASRASALDWLRRGFDLVADVARARGVRPAWSLGPTALGAHEAERARETLQEVATVIADHAPNAPIFVESFTAAAELRLAVAALADAGLAREVWLLLVPDVTGVLRDGTSIELFAAELDGRIAGLGIGCVAPEVDVGENLERLTEASTLPLVLAPPCFGNALAWAGQIAAVAARVPLDTRLRWIGGCCGTGPGHVAALCSALREVGISIDVERRD